MPRDLPLPYSLCFFAVKNDDRNALLPTTLTSARLRKDLAKGLEEIETKLKALGYVARFSRQTS
jgi:hypothetical protein